MKSHRSPSSRTRPPHNRLDPLAALKERISSALEQELSGIVSVPFIRQIVNEAAAVASTTAFPVLLFPVLAEEKAQRASEWSARQDAIRHQQLPLAA